MTRPFALGLVSGALLVAGLSLLGVISWEKP